MELVVISSSQKSNSEIPIIEELFESGLNYFHVKKRNWSRQKMTEYLSKIPKKYHNRIVLHNHYGLALKFNLAGVHIGRREKTSFKARMKIRALKLIKPSIRVSISYNNLQDLIACRGKFAYIFLKAIFDRHNATEFNQPYNPKQLAQELEACNHKVYALGGVNAARVRLASQCGFDGVVLQGSFWSRREKKMDFFQSVVESCNVSNPRKKSMDIQAVKIQMPGRAS